MLHVVLAHLPAITAELLGETRTAGSSQSQQTYRGTSGLKSDVHDCVYFTFLARWLILLVKANSLTENY